jgi:cobalt-zinc-cadmium efflux system outer membrane protein
MRNYIIILLMLSLLFAGCAEEEINHSYDEYAIESVSEPTAEHSQEIVSVVEPEGVLTLREVLALTLMGNPELKVYSLETRVAEARELQAGLWPNPEIEMEIEKVGGTGKFRGFDAPETTIGLSQLIELGNKSQKRKKIASYEKELAGLEYQNKRLEVFSEATKAFVSVLKDQGQLELSDELLKLSEESFEAVKKRVEAGKDSPIEKTRASVSFSKNKIMHRETQRNLTYSRKRLSSFWGEGKPLFEEAAGDMDSIEELPSLEALVDQLKLTPEYTRWATEIKRSQAVLELEKANTLGDITLGAGYKQSDGADDKTFVFGVSIPFPISDRNQGARQAAVYEVAKSREGQKAAWLRLQNEFNETYQEYANSYGQAMSLKEEVLPGAVEMFDAARRAYQEGKVDYLNMLDAQRTLFEVKNEYIESLAACHSARIDIERFIGEEIEAVTISESE